MTPMSHLQGNKCNYCAKEERKRIIYGVGINDLYIGTHSDVYSKWYNMIRRCYDKKYHINKPSYEEAAVCEEWKHLSNFKLWFDENYIEGYHLDKDILVKGNKVYSPETCCFVPNDINALLTKSNGVRGELPIGVRLSKNKKKFEARLSVYKGYIHLGSFDTKEEAFEAYKIAKENWVKKTAKNFHDKKQIPDNVYKALLDYEVSIND